MNRLEFIGLLAELENKVNLARTVIQRGRNYPDAYRHLEDAQTLLRRALPEAAAYTVAWGEPLKIEAS